MYFFYIVDQDLDPLNTILLNLKPRVINVIEKLEYSALYHPKTYIIAKYGYCVKNSQIIGYHDIQKR